MNRQPGTFKEKFSEYTKTGNLTQESAHNLLNIGETEVVRYTISALRTLQDQVWSENLRTNEWRTWASKKDILHAIRLIAQESVWEVSQMSEESEKIPQETVETETEEIKSVREKITDLSKIPSSVGIFWDSLTVGMLWWNNTINDIRGIGKVGASIETIEQNFYRYVDSHKNSLTKAYILGGTNNIVWADAASIIATMNRIQKFGQFHGIEVIFGTLPPLGKYIEKRSNSQAIESARNQVNQYVRSNGQHIDYDRVVRDEQKPEYLKNSWDGLHPRNYTQMQELLVNHINQNTPA